MEKHLQVLLVILMAVTINISAQWSELGGTNSSTFNGAINCVTTDVNGNVYAGGNFTNTNNKNYLALWNGKNWTEIGGSNTSTFSGSVYTVVTDGKGNTYVGGNFRNNYGSYVDKWNGNFWNELIVTENNSSNYTGHNGTINSITANVNGNVYAAGTVASDFNLAPFVAKMNGYNFYALDDNGCAAPFYTYNFDLYSQSIINSIATDKSGNVYAAGLFGFGGHPYVAINNGSGCWGALGGYNDPTFNGYINSITIDDKGNVYAAGVFTNSIGKPYVAKWNGISWAELGGNNTSIFNSSINCITTDVIGNIYAAGYNSNGKYNIAKWNGSSWRELGGSNISTFNNQINSIITDENGNLYAAGYFTNSKDKPYVAKFNGAFTPSITWSGTTSTNWNDATNWSSGVVPTSTSNVIIPDAPLNPPSLSSDVVVGDIALNNNVNLNGHTLTINGAVTGTGSLIGSATSSLNIGGTAGTINFDANNNSLQNLTINGTVTLGNTLKLYNKLIANTGGTLNTGGNLILKSMATGSAIVEKVNGIINGIVKVEIYIPKGYSAHRDLGVCVSGAGTIANTWGDSLKNYLVYNYNAASGWATVPNTSSLNQYIGYRVLVSGHNNPVVPSTYISYMNSDVTLAYSGTLLSGNQSIPLTGGADKFSFISNPYASQVDFNALTKSGLYDGYWYLDPTTLYGNYENYNYFGTNIGLSNVFAKSAAQYLQPSQGFFVCSNSATPSLTFTESAKNNNNAQAAIFGITAPLNRIATGLFANGKNLDGAVVVFNSKFSNSIAKEDGLKINNQAENVTYNVAGKDLCANGWGLPTETDELPLHLYHLNTNTAYALRLDVSQFVGNGLSAYLNDKILNKRTLLVGDSTIVSFTTTTDTSIYSNRYSVVFKPTTLPLESIVATTKALQNNQVAINWSVVNEKKVSSYQVQRSIDGINFIDLAIIFPTSKNNYSYIDRDIENRTNYYRVKALGNDGNVRYSNISSIDLSINNYQLSIYPNPVSNGSFKIGLSAVGKYWISLANKNGRIIYNTQLNHTVANALEKIVIGKLFAVGCYTLTATDDSGKTINKEIIIK